MYPLVGTPAGHGTELQTVITVLGDMKQPNPRWQIAVTRGVGVFISDTIMFGRTAPQPSDQYLGSFYGLAIPLVKRGIPVDPVQIESSTTPEFLNRYKVLFLTYEGQKPPKPEFHAALAKWLMELLPCAQVRIGVLRRIVAVLAADVPAVQLHRLHAVLRLVLPIFHKLLVRNRVVFFRRIHPQHGPGVGHLSPNRAAAVS